MKTVIVSGALANKPHNGGEAWVRLSWARGFQKLGFNVVFIEQMDSPCAQGADYFERVTQQFGLNGALIEPSRIVGSSREQVIEAAESAEMLVNISGHLRDADLLRRMQRKVFVDIDPGYTQIWHEQKLALVGRHDFYYTIAANMGSSGCTIPTGGIPWRVVRQPVVLDDWPVLPPPKQDRFTTVAAWRGSFGTVAHDGKTYGQKAHEFRKFLDLPKRSPHEFEIALQIHPGDAKDLASLREHGWKIVEPRDVAADPESFRGYVQRSSAEFSVAQGIYVETNSGWFSDRTVRYLASGRPALVQETGFSSSLPTGSGLIPFRNLDEAVAGAQMLTQDYQRHSAAARELAEKYFDSDKVLSQLCDEVGVSP